MRASPRISTGIVPMNKFEPMIPVEEGLHVVDMALGHIKPAGEVALVREALGRVVLSDQRSVVNLPSFDKSAMDGYAVLPDDERDEYRLLETIPAGHVGTKELKPGTTVKVMTGAPVPEGTGRVIKIEHTEECGNLVMVRKHDGAANICKRGEDVRTGEVILRAGTALYSLEIANLISCGITEVEVARRVKVAVISTGDEIVNSPDLLAPGKIMNSNGPMLSSLAREFGLDVASEVAVSDDRQAIEDAIRAGTQSADVLVLSGGVSVGEFDFVLSTLEDIGLKVHFSRLAVQPGKPTVFASRGDKAAFGLPGNPVSAFLMFHLFVLRAAGLMSGHAPEVRELRLRLASDFRRKKLDRKLFVPARITDDGAIEPITYHGSAHLAALMQADGFLVVPSGVGEMAAGSEAGFVPIRRIVRW